MSHELEQLGLSPGESSIYFQLLRLGTLPLNVLVKKSRLSRKSALDALQALTEKGLIQQNKTKGGPTFTVLDSKQLVAHLDAKVQHAQAQRDKAGKVLELLKGQLAPSAARSKIQYFTSVEGARLAIEDTLTAKDKTLRAFLSVADLEDFLGSEFLEKYAKRRVAAGLALQAVRTFERDKRARRRTRSAKPSLSNKEEAREVRYVNEDHAFPVTTYLYDNKILTIAGKQENFAFICESKELAEMQKHLFQLIWRSLTIREIASDRSPG